MLPKYNRGVAELELDLSVAELDGLRVVELEGARVVLVTAGKRA